MGSWGPSTLIFLGAYVGGIAALWRRVRLRFLSCWGKGETEEEEARGVKLVFRDFFLRGVGIESGE